MRYFVAAAFRRAGLAYGIRAQRYTVAPRKYRGTRLIFITLCCEAKKSVFADGERAWWLIDCVRKEAQASRFAVHAFCVMPDHFHALVQGLDRSSDLLDFVKTLKQKSAFQHRQRLGEVLWQKKFFDHIVRSQDSWERVAWYIWMNPVRKGLCAHAQDYPFSGSFTMDWKGAARSEPRNDSFPK